MDNIDSSLIASMSPSAPYNQQPAFFSQQVSDARRFYLDLAPGKRKALTVACGGRETCLPDYVVDRQDFPYFSLEFVSRGRGKLLLAQAETELSAGVAYTYGPGIPHRIESDARDTLEKYFVNFAGKEVPKLLGEIHLQPGSVRRIHGPLDIQRALDDLILHGTRSSGSTSNLCNALMQYILQLVATTASPVATSFLPSYSTYVRCREYLEQQYLKLQSLDEAARETRVDKTYLCRLFQKFDSQTPYEYLTRLKMNKAAELLDDSDLLIKQIAASVGYGDAFHFSRVFKGVFGVSPREFRRLRTLGETASQ